MAAVIKFAIVHLDNFPLTLTQLFRAVIRLDVTLIQLHSTLLADLDCSLTEGERCRDLGPGVYLRGATRASCGGAAAGAAAKCASSFGHPLDAGVKRTVAIRSKLVAHRGIDLDKIVEYLPHHRLTLYAGE